MRTSLYHKLEVFLLDCVKYVPDGSNGFEIQQYSIYMLSEMTDTKPVNSVRHGMLRGKTAVRMNDDSVTAFGESGTGIILYTVGKTRVMFLNHSTEQCGSRATYNHHCCDFSVSEAFCVCVCVRACVCVFVCSFYLARQQRGPMLIPSST